MHKAPDPRRRFYTAENARRWLKTPVMASEQQMDIRDDLNLGPAANVLALYAIALTTGLLAPTTVFWYPRRTGYYDTLNVKKQ